MCDTRGMEINPELLTKLPRTYTLWYHNPNEDNWKTDSYHEILSFQTVEEFWIMTKHIKPHMIEFGMFFLMQDGVAPVWEDPQNINGGVLSWKVENKIAFKYWTETVIHFISNNLLINQDTNSIINGVCISPKRNFNIIKIWINKVIDYTQFKYSKTLTMAENKAIYKSHINNIQKDSQKDHEEAKYNGRNKSYARY
jgi:translation initiation factor 4E